ncbi:potassium transporter [Clostridioides difficile]|nr:potassium transporter [Clostridioides difficile]
MWYVNTKLEVEKAIESKGFILTMWYVNVYSIKNLSPYCYTFYINYVVCK